MRELTVVIPVYNEEEIIQEVIADWDKHLKVLNIDYIVNIYNDGSTDNTKVQLESLKSNYKNLEIHHEKNSGHGPTILNGYLDGLDSKWLFQIDSDNEISASNFSQFWKVKDNFDFLVGYRIDRESPMVRKFITMVSNTIVGLFYGFGIKDCNVPFRLMRVQAFKEHIESIPKNTFAPNIIISGLALKNKLRVKNIPVKYRFRKTGKVSINKLKLLKVSVLSFKQTILYAFR